MGIGLAVGVAALLASAPADEGAAKPLNLSRPTSGYTYYNHPGASVAEQDRDLRLCVERASLVRSVDEQMGAGAGLGLIGQLLGGAIADAANSGVMAASIENCMVVYGWRVVRLSDAEGKALSDLPPAELKAKLAPWVGAAQPQGDVVRAWANDAANGTINHFSLRPGHTKKGQLSLLAIADGAAAAVPDKPEKKGKPEKPVYDAKWSKGSLKPAELASAPAGSGIVIVGVKGLGMTRGNGLVFRRISPKPDLPAWAVDHAPDWFSASGSTLGGSKMLAFALPPGRWRIASDINGLMELNYCLGSPSFELKAGETLYAGTLDLKSEKLQPDFSLAPVEAWLAGTDAARTVKPAAYTNGSVGACGPNSIYAIEFENAPFEPGYEYGSRAWRGDQAAAR